MVLIKKVDGDRKKLLEDLVETLGVSKQDIRLNPTTQHIELKVRAPKSTCHGCFPTSISS